MMRLTLQGTTVTASMEFVSAASPEHDLLLTVIRKLDDNTQAVTELQNLFLQLHNQQNVLSDFKPPDKMTAEQEAGWLRRHLTYGLDTGQTRLTMPNIGINHDVNVEHLKNNGFSVEPWRPGEHPRCFIVRWHSSRDPNPLVVTHMVT